MKKLLFLFLFISIVFLSNINAQLVDNKIYKIHCTTWKCIEENMNKDAIVEGYFRKYTPEKCGKGAGYMFWDWEILLSDSIAIPVKSKYTEINYSAFENTFVQIKGLIFFGIIIGGNRPEEQAATGYRIDPSFIEKVK